MARMHHHDDYVAGEGFAAASWMMAMLAVMIAAVLLIGVLLWAPWHSSTVTNSGTGSGGNQPEQQAPNQQQGGQGQGSG